MNSIAQRPRLDHATALQAVADYQRVVACGAREQLHSELRTAYREAESHRLRRPIGAFFQAKVTTGELARLLDLDPAELLPAVEAFFMGDDRTAIALRVLREFAERLRRDGKGVN